MEQIPQSKEAEVQQLLKNLDVEADANRSQVDVHNSMADTLAEAWRDLNEKLVYRGTLLEQSVNFHRSAQDVSQANKRRSDKEKYTLQSPIIIFQLCPKLDL